MAPVLSKQCFTTTTTSALSMSAIAPPEETLATSDTTTASPFAHQIPGKTVAEGNIVSFFNGGFAAVRLKDDEALGGDEATPIPNQQQQSSSTSSSSSNLGDDLIGRLARLPNGSMGVVLALRPPVAFVYSDCSEWDEESSGNVEIFETMATISVPEHVLNGGIVNCFGQGEEEESSPSSSSSLNRAMLAPIPQVKDIALINSPMLTGSTMVDALAPIGKGQNMLLVGSDLNEMRGLACDFLSTQLRNPQSVCVYAATQDREAALSKLRRAGIADDVIVVGARPKPMDGVAKAAEAASVAATACAIGESFALQQGKDAIVVVDTIDAHKELWDATTRVLVDVYGTEAVVKADREGAASSEMRAYYSSLIQRSAQFNARNGGGSLTLALLTTIPGMDGGDGDSSNEVEFSASDFEGCGDKIKARIDMLVDKKIPLTVATLRKIQIPIPSASEGRRRLALQHIDDLISMSDGQIWLDDDLHRQGQRPPMDPQRSITRIGIGADTQSRADAPAIRRVVEGVRLDLAQAANMEGAEATTASMKQIRKRNAWLLAMHQEEGDGGRTLAESCVVLLAAANGLLDDTIDAGALAGTEDGQAVVSQLLDHVKSRAPGAMEAINESLDIGPEARSEIEEAMDSFIP